ncbi:aminotransferase-like domain-containing protein [Kribbella deserti]|uniref:PLP-dependent aminotransferase family protein n=1 Tax=Kribbella deserti TaxID=1926257 RepID=A0ABV6QPS5_9ACTN
MAQACWQYGPVNRSIRDASDRSKDGSDFLQLTPDEAPAGGLADWLAASLRTAIADGRLPIGSRLPATRVLAADLGVSRGVVTEAYQRLTEDGHIVGRGRAGTIVVAVPHIPPAVRTNSTPTARALGTRANAPADAPSGSGRSSAQGGGRGGASGQGGPGAPSGFSGLGRRGAPSESSGIGGSEEPGRPIGSTGLDGYSGPRGSGTPGRPIESSGGSGSGASSGRGGGEGGGGRGRAWRGGQLDQGGGARDGAGREVGGTVFEREPGLEVFEAARAAPARIDLSPGVPDLASFPRTAWLRAERAVLSGLSAADFGYGDPRGAPVMRAAVADWLARYRGISVDPAEVIMVAGVAQTLDLLAQILQQDGVKELAVEEPGSLGTRQQFHHRDVTTTPVSVDEDGIVVHELRATGAPAVLLTPAHHFPTGVVLGGERRRELMQWAGEGGLIVEDDYDAEHRYDRPPVPAIRSMLADQVCYTGSVSKLLAPALRVGWVLPPAKYREHFIAAKRYADLGNAVLPQLVLAHLMNSGELERQLRFLRRRHKQRRDIMIAAIREHLPAAKVHGAAAGLHLMITFDGDFSDGTLAAEVLARGVKVQPLSWHHQRPARPGLVLGYAANSPSDLTEGIATIAAALHEQ